MFNAFCFNSVPLNTHREPERDVNGILPANHTELRTWAGRDPGRSDLAAFVLSKLIGRTMPPKLNREFVSWADSIRRSRGRPKLHAAARDKFICERYLKYLTDQQENRRMLTPAEKRAIPKADRPQMAPNFLAAKKVADELRQLRFPPISPAHVQKIYSSAKKNPNFSK